MDGARTLCRYLNLMLKPELYLAVGISGQIQQWLALTRRKPFSPSIKIKMRHLPVRGLRHCWRRREDPSGATAALAR